MLNIFTSLCFLLFSQPANTPTYAQNGVTLTDLAYDYAVDGQLAGVRDLLAPDRSLALAYDNLNRLTMVSAGIPVADGGTPVPVEDFTYDGTGNRLSSHLSSLYLSDNHNRLTEDANYVYAYDDKGNRVSRTAKAGGAVEEYTYNSVNKLTAYDSGDGTTASYHYDALGRRIAKVVDGVETAYVYDPWNPYNPTANDILLEYQGSALTRRWLHGSRIDEPLAFEAYSGTTAGGSGAANEVYADRQGSVLAVVDPTTGTVAAAYTYDSFGKITQVTGTLNQPFAYTGREYDAETGLYYYRARHYDPSLGQFIQSDPIGFAAGDLNIYTYVSNDPFNWSDPSGLSSTCRRGVDGTPECGAMVTGIITPGMVSAAVGIAAMLAVASSFMSGSGDGDDGDDGRPKIGHNGGPSLGSGPRGPGWGMAAAVAAAITALEVVRSNSSGFRRAQNMADYIDEFGKAPNGYKGGQNFKNNEGLLPKYDSNGNKITYREWDVNPYQSGVNRGSERLVTGSNGTRYYTGDHYGSFTEF